jgi:hypothetical protein
MIAICAILKNEHRFLKEWIDHHLALGVDAIHLFEDKGSISHESITSAYENVFLRRYQDDKEVQWLLRNQAASHRQRILYSWFAVKYRETYDWAAFIDLDEFIMFADGYNFERLCNEFEPYPGIMLSWQMMSANNHIQRPNCGVVEAYTQPERNCNYDKGWWQKSFCNLKRWQGMYSLHRANGCVNTDFKANRFQLLYDKAWINHYFTKSWEDWCDRIFNRGGTLVGHRRLTDFFELNSSMLHIKDELVNSVSHKIPNGTYYLDKQNKLIAGGNLKKINDLNNGRNILHSDRKL